MPKIETARGSDLEKGRAPSAAETAPAAAQGAVPPTPGGNVVKGVVKGDPRREEGALDSLVKLMESALREAQRTAGAVVLRFRFEDGSERSISYLPPLEIEVSDFATLALVADALATLPQRLIVETRVEVTEEW
jgi:hypothetical protein